jgi:hypothetical protein
MFVARVFVLPASDLPEVKRNQDTAEDWGENDE